LFVPICQRFLPKSVFGDFYHRGNHLIGSGEGTGVGWRLTLRRKKKDQMGDSVFIQDLLHSKMKAKLRYVELVTLFNLEGGNI